MNDQNQAFPMVSVIRVVYNYGRYLREAIDSAFGQTYPYPTYKVILVNDGSMDETEEIALSYGSRIRYHFQEHQGFSTPKNKGVRLAQGEYLTLTT